MSQKLFTLITLLTILTPTLQTKKGEENKIIEIAPILQIPVTTITYTTQATMTNFKDTKLSVQVRDAINSIKPGFMTGKIITNGSYTNEVTNENLDNAKHIYSFNVGNCHFDVTMIGSNDLSENQTLKETLDGCEQINLNLI